MAYRNKETIEKVGLLSERDVTALKGLVPAIGQKVPEDYDKMRQKEREQKATDQNAGALELLVNSIEWYNSNNKKSSIKIGKGTLDKELDKLTEDQLFEIQAIFDFCHDKNENGERLIVTFPDHTKMNYTLAKIKKLIPGFAQRVELMRLENEESNIEKRKSDLRNQIKNAQNQFKQRNITPIKEINEVKIPDAPQEPSIYICPKCGKDCKNAGGLGKHVKYSHELKEIKEQIPENAEKQ